ncbi:hypothetical protein FRC02_006542, partial [Tulasnella sp. 418]
FSANSVPPRHRRRLLRSDPPLPAIHYPLLVTRLHAGTTSYPLIMNITIITVTWLHPQDITISSL